MDMSISHPNTTPLDARTARIIEVRTFKPIRETGGVEIEKLEVFLGSTNGPKFRTAQEAWVAWNELAYTQGLNHGFEDVAWEDMTEEQRSLFVRIADQVEINEKITASVNRGIPEMRRSK